MLRASCWKGLGQYTLAYVDMTSAILKHSNPIPSYYFNSRAGVLLHLERYNDSLNDLNTSIDIKANNPHSLYNRAVLYSDHITDIEGNFQLALEDLNKAISLMEETMKGKLKKSGITDMAILNESAISFKVLHLARSADEQQDRKFIFKLRLLRGCIRRNLELFSGALDDLKEAVSLDVTCGNSWNALGKVYYEMSNAEEAEKAFANAVEIDEECPEFTFDRGRSRLMIYNQKKFMDDDKDILRSAVEDLKTAINLQLSEEEEAPPKSLAKLKLQRASFQNGLSAAYVAFGNNVNNLNALDAIKVALEIDPRNHRYLHQCGMVYLSIKRKEDAFYSFRSALDIEPDYCPSLYNIGKLYYTRGDLARSFLSLSKCISLNDAQTSDDEVYHHRGLVLFAQSRLHDAQKDFTTSLHLGSNKLENYFKRGEAKRLSGDFSSALEDLAIVEREGPDSPILDTAMYRFSRGMCLAHLGDLKNGLTDLTLAAELNPLNTDYILERAGVLTQLGMLFEAEQALEGGVKIALREKAGNTWDLLHKLSMVLFKQKKFEESSTTIHRALLHSGQCLCKTDIAQLLYVRGVCLATLKKYARALPCFTDALAIKEAAGRPERILYLHERAKCNQMVKKHHEAIEDFSEVIKLAPRDHRAIFRRAWSYKALGLYLLAAEDFETALVLKPNCKIYKLNYRAIGVIDCMVLISPGNEEIPDEHQDKWLQSLQK